MNGRAPRAALLVGTLALAGVFAGCAPDAWKPNPTYDAFLNKVDKNCGTMRIGEASISQLMNPGSNLYSAYFVDMTSRFESGRISTEDYMEGIASTFTTILDTAGIRCIIAQKNP
ncbi:MAG TPA: hypothetical protein PLG77_02720 [Burkholderiaceae bacterium]|nr:hypothetical protein [Burkholderiaceae bacterium]HRP27330.1 hypothetical protein [Burkholderiaceae bacterium]